MALNGCKVKSLFVFAPHRRSSRGKQVVQEGRLPNVLRFSIVDINSIGCGNGLATINAKSVSIFQLSFKLYSREVGVESSLVV